jgi:hypothetical protein
MEIRIYEIEGSEPSECIGIIDNYSSFDFTKSFKKVGTWTLKGYLTTGVSQLLAPYRMIWVDEDICGIIDSVDYTTDENGATTYIAYGSELKNILSYRILTDNYNTDGSEPQSIEYWMKKLVKDEAANPVLERRKVLGSVKETSLSITPACSSAFLYGDELLDDLSTLCVYNDCTDGMQIGFDVKCPKAKETRFEVKTGLNRTWESENPLIVSREYDNAASLDYIRSSKSTINVVTILGDDEIYEMTKGEETYKGISRREKFVEEENLSRTVKNSDGTETEMDESTYREKLLAKAYTYTQADIKSLEAQTILKTYGLPDFSDLGAMVTIMDKQYNMRANDWVSEINFIDEQGEIEVNYTVGQDIQAKYLTEVK